MILYTPLNFLKEEEYGMQLSEAEKQAMYISRQLRNYVKDKVDHFSTFNMMDQPHIEFSIEFQAYDYFTVVFNYDRGRFGCAINNGSSGIALKNSQKWYDQADMTIFLKELEQQIEIRIPDKFLEFNGWK